MSVTVSTSLPTGTIGVDFEQLGRGTARSFQKLAGLRGIGSTIEYCEGRYFATRADIVQGQLVMGERIDCGVSVHGLYAWLNSQPGVKA